MLGQFVPGAVSESEVGVIVTPGALHVPLTVTVVVAETLVSCTERAVTVYVPAAVAVKSPAELMLPPEDVHVTACDGLLVPFTVAVNCCVAEHELPVPDKVIVGLSGESVTEVTVGRAVVVVKVPHVCG